MTTRKKLIIGSTIALVLIGATIAYNRNKKKKLIGELYRIIDSGEGATGTIDDIQNKINMTINTKAVPKDYSPIVSRAYQNIKNAHGVVNDDEDKVYSALRSIRNIEELKLLNQIFYAKEGKELIPFLKTFLDETELGIVNQIIGKLK